MSGKGDKQIKAQVPWQTYSDNWDRAFSKKEAWINIPSSMCSRIAEQLLEEDKAVCDRLEKAADTKQT
ncbi:MAG: hypothetical protein KAJ03_05400 [Gammaproteobacteria bacterium]|nr:hypothetical protein [Gammaproteobacteria bacterium]